jgi:hypothetical protein
MQRATTPPLERGEQFTDAQLEAALQLMWNDYSVRPQWIIVPPGLRKFVGRLLRRRRAYIGGCSARARKRTLWRPVSPA